MASAVLDSAADIFKRGSKKTVAELDEETVRALHAKSGDLAIANDPPQDFRSPTGATVFAPMSRKLNVWIGK